MPNYKVDKNTAPHYKWGDDCDGWVFADTENMSVKREAMPGHSREKSHIHQLSQQLFYILEGIATFSIGTDTVVAREHQSVIIPPGTVHLISNEADSPLEFIVISQPTTTGDRTDLE